MPVAPTLQGGVALQQAHAEANDDRVILRFLNGRFREALKAYRAGQFEKAWKISEAILVLAPANDG